MKSHTHFAGALLAVLIFSSAISAQHKRADSPSGGKVKKEITVSVPTSIFPGARGARKEKTTTETLVAITEDEAGTWYYSIATVSRELNITSFIVGFAPRDLADEREYYKRKFWDSDRVKADAYLTYKLSVYSVEMLCASGQYRFGAARLDVGTSGPLGGELTAQDWREWRDTAGTPWESVRARICR